MKVLMMLAIVGLLGVSGYYLWNTREIEDRKIGESETTNTTNNNCDSDGCGSESMVHSIEIKDEKVFIGEMIPHHQEAIDTSELVLTQTSDKDLKSFTKAVVEAQSREVEEMKKWLKDWYGEEYVVNSNYMPMMGELNSYEGRELEKMYVEGMIRHHQGAVEMAKAVLALNPRKEVEDMAENIIAVQESEIDVLTGWLGSKYSDIDVKDETHHMMDIH